MERLAKDWKQERKKEKAKLKKPGSSWFKVVGF